MSDAPRCYMARPGERRLTPMVDPGGPAFLLPAPPEDIDPMSGWLLALDSDSPPVQSAARAVLGLHHDVDTGPLRCETIRAVELRRHEFAGQSAHRIAVYARTVGEAREAVMHSEEQLLRDLGAHTNPNPSRTSEPG